MYVCMSVRNRFTTKYTMQDLEERRRRQARERVQRYIRGLFK